jgi:hypothetical protein
MSRVCPTGGILLAPEALWLNPEGRQGISTRNCISMQRQRLVQRLAKPMTRYGAGFRELEKETTNVIAVLDS